MPVSPHRHYHRGSSAPNGTIPQYCFHHTQEVDLRFPDPGQWWRNKKTRACVLVIPHAVPSAPNTGIPYHDKWVRYVDSFGSIATMPTADFVKQFSFTDVKLNT